MSAHSDMEASPEVKPKGQGRQSKYWTGVLNNYTEEELNSLTQLDCPELLIARETGKEGTPHLHLYLKLHKRQHLSYLKKLAERAHWEVVRSRPAAIEYCEKDGDVVVKRLLTKPERPTLGAAIDCMRSAGLAGVARDYPDQFVLHHRGLQALQYALAGTEPKRVPQVTWIYGPTGSGKTRLAYEGLSQDNIYILTAPNTRGGALWFDGYLNQDRVILDDFRPWWCKFDFLLRLLDRYPISVQVKGGFVRFNPAEIVITTPLSIEETFTGEYRTEEDLRQIKRRVHRKIRMVDVTNWVYE